MTANFHAPTELLKPFVKTYVIVESLAGDTNRVLPDTSLVMAFRFKGEVNYMEDGHINTLQQSVISGLRKTARVINYSPNAGNVLVIFKEAVASAFFKEPIHELFSDSVPLYNFIDKQKLADIEERLALAANNTQRINLVEQLLLSKLCNFKPDVLIAAALDKIRLAKGAIKMKELADALYISQDAFEKRFRRVVGVSPKQYAYIIRMRALIGTGLKKTEKLTEIAFDAGYFDQPHFNKDFKLFTGQIPTDFFKSPVFW